MDANSADPPRRAAGDGRAAARLRPLLKKIVFALVPTIVVLGLAEIGARILIPESPGVLLQTPLGGAVNLDVPEFFEPHPRLFWVLRPGLRKPPAFWGDITNSRGFRMRTEPGERSEPIRILCLGDSCTYGLGLPVDLAWPAALDRLLEGAEVVNAGVPGYTSYQGRVFFEERCEDLEPDALVVAFGQNDVLTWYTKQHGRWVHLSDRERAAHFDCSRNPSRLLQWLLSGGLRRPRAVPDDEPVEKSAPRVSLPDFRANLEHFARLAPVVVFVAWSRRTAHVPASKESYPTRRLRIYREAILAMEEAGHPVVDVETLFRESGLPPERLFRDAVHATEEGCRLVAQSLARRLRERIPRLRSR